MQLKLYRVALEWRIVHSFIQRDVKIIAVGTQKINPSGITDFAVEKCENGGNRNKDSEKEIKTELKFADVATLKNNIPQIYEDVEVEYFGCSRGTGVQFECY